MDERLKSALVKRAWYMIQEFGFPWFLKWKYDQQACGCMGPSDGEPYCSCKMRALLDEYKVTVLNEIDPNEALKLMRIKIIRALR